jgi:hypothetical protein
MATSPRVAMRAVRNLYGLCIPKVRVPEAATVTATRGALAVSTSGYVDECGADPALILGLLTADGGNKSSAGDALQEVEVAMPGTLFMGNLSNAADSAVGAATDRFKPYGVLKDATSETWFVDTGETSNDRVVIWEFWLQDAEVLTDTRTRVIFQFDPVYCQGNAVD